MSSRERAAECFAAGQPTLVAGLRGEEAAVVLAARRTNPRRLEQLHELGGDMVVLGLGPTIAERLRLSAPRGAMRRRTGIRLATPIDASNCVGGGWSLAERAHTIRVAADPATRPGDLTVPGHVRAGHIDDAGYAAPAVALELARVAEQPEAVVLSSVLDRAGGPVSLAAALRDDRLRALPAAPIDELCGLALAREPGMASAQCELPTRLGDFRVLATTAADGGEVTVTLIHGDPAGRPRPVIRTHVACLLGDTFGSLLCDCHDRLERSTDAILAQAPAS